MANANFILNISNSSALHALLPSFMTIAAVCRCQNAAFASDIFLSLSIRAASPPPIFPYREQLPSFLKIH
jgi:hypothetical protein